MPWLLNEILSADYFISSSLRLARIDTEADVLTVSSASSAAFKPSQIWGHHALMKYFECSELRANIFSSCLMHPLSVNEHGSLGHADNVPMFRRSQIWLLKACRVQFSVKI
jgi:hypothetical protein